MLALRHMPRSTLASVRVIAADVDGTVTTAGRITPETVTSFEALQRIGCAVVLVTGRSAGWAAALARYLPGLAGVVAENGAVLFPASAQDTAPVLLDTSSAERRVPSVLELDACLDAVLHRYPEAHPGVDNFCRLSDRTVEVGAGIDPDVVGAIAAAAGVAHTYSSVHHHLSRSSLTKRTGLLAALAELLPVVEPGREVVTIGDSGNDAALFDARSFAATVGVSNIRLHLDALGPSVPSFVTDSDGGDGFNELATLVLGAR
jgi:hydroxymethylpyrimidine pyrophosphatase-like HAD family hydrolase